MNQIRLALSFVWKSSRFYTTLVLSVQIIQAIIPLTLLYLTKLIIDSFGDSLKDSGGFDDIVFYLLLFGLVHLVHVVVNNIQQLASDSQQQLVSDYMSTIIIDKASEVDISYYENPTYFNTLHQAQSQALYRPTLILRNLTDLVSSILMLVSLAGLLFFLHWAIAIILLIFAIPIALVKWRFSNKIFEWEKNSTDLEREAIFYNEILTSDVYAKEVRIFNLSEDLKNKFSKLRKELYTQKFKINSNKATASILAKSLEIIAMISTFSFIAWRTYYGNNTIGDLVMYFQAFQRGQNAMQSCLSSLVGLYENKLFLSHLFDFLKVESLLKIAKSEVQEGTEEVRRISLNNVSFKYPNTSKEVLSNINLNFEKGQIIALVGENGSGKSTLVKLLCRFYDPTSGIVSYNGNPIINYSLKEFRSKISLVFQDFAKYQFSVDDNIHLGDLFSPLSADKKLNASRIASSLDFIFKLPKKFQQKIGRWFPEGQELSGGEWQKIALTRAFYKEAEILILDEPSSAIDPLSEEIIFSNLRNIVEDKILILVTHRLYNLKSADKIVVLNNGVVVEEGNHDDLMRKAGEYFRMFNAQSK